MTRIIFTVTSIIAILLLTIAVPTLSTYPDWNDISGNLVVNPSFEQGLTGWTVYGTEPVLDSGIAYHGSKSLYFEYITYEGQRLIQEISLVFDFIMIFHIYGFSNDDRQCYAYPPDQVSIYYWDETNYERVYQVGVYIDYMNDYLTLFSHDPDAHEYSIPFPFDRWVTIMIVKVGRSAHFYIDGEYVTTLPAALGPFNEISIDHHDCYGPWVFDAIYVGRISNLTVNSHGGSGNHYEDTTNNVLKAEAFALPDSIESATTYIKYKTVINFDDNYTFYIPMDYKIRYGIEYGGFVYAKLTVRVWNADTYEEIDSWTKYLVYRIGQVSEIKTVEGTITYNKVLELKHGEYYVEIYVHIYVHAWDGEAWIDMFGSSYYLDAWIPGYEI